MVWSGPHRLHMPLYVALWYYDGLGHPNGAINPLPLTPHIRLRGTPLSGEGCLLYRACPSFGRYVFDSTIRVVSFAEGGKSGVSLFTFSRKQLRDVLRQILWVGHTFFCRFSNRKCVTLKMAEVLILVIPLYSQKSGVYFYLDIRF